MLDSLAGSHYSLMSNSREKVFNFLQKCFSIEATRRTSTSKTCLKFPSMTGPQARKHLLLFPNCWTSALQTEYMRQQIMICRDRLSRTEKRHILDMTLEDRQRRFGRWWNWTLPLSQLQSSQQSSGCHFERSTQIRNIRQRALWRQIEQERVDALGRVDHVSQNPEVCSRIDKWKRWQSR